MISFLIALVIPLSGVAGAVFYTQKLRGLRIMEMKEHEMLAVTKHMWPNELVWTMIDEATAAGIWMGFLAGILVTTFIAWLLTRSSHRDIQTPVA